MRLAKKRERDKSRISTRARGRRRDRPLRGLAVKARARQVAKETKATEVAERKEERLKKKEELYTQTHTQELSLLQASLFMQM